MRFGGFRLGDFFLGFAVTQVRVGAGRSPGVVDLPIVRDPLGWPFLPASSVKGGLKSACELSKFSMDSVDCSIVYGWDVKQAERAEFEPYVSAVALTDASILFYPVRVEGGEEGLRFCYASSPYLLRRAYGLAAEVLELKECAAEAACPRELVKVLGGLEDAGVEVGRLYVNTVYVENARMVEGGALERLLSLSGLGGNPVASWLGSCLLVLSDDDMLSVVESGIVRLARVRLDYRTKTVEAGPWTEEYLPEATVFLLASFYRDTEVKGRLVRAEDARRFHLSLLESMNWHVVVGGRETLGRGILRLYAPPGVVHR